LSGRDHPMLPLGDFGDRRIGPGDFSVHFTDKSPGRAFLPRSIGRLGRCGC
jgi:hypothetical protein